MTDRTGNSCILTVVVNISAARIVAAADKNSESTFFNFERISAFGAFIRDLQNGSDGFSNRNRLHEGTFRIV